MLEKHEDGLQTREQRPWSWALLRFCLRLKEPYLTLVTSAKGKYQKKKASKSELGKKGGIGIIGAYVVPIGRITPGRGKRTFCTQGEL